MYEVIKGLFALSLSCAVALKISSLRAASHHLFSTRRCIHLSSNRPQATSDPIIMEAGSNLSDPVKRAQDFQDLLWAYENNRSIRSDWHYGFLVAYIIVGFVALFANGLVVVAVVRNKKVRTCSA